MAMIFVTFVKAGDIPEYKRSLQAHDSHPATPKLPVQISPRIFPQYYRSPYIQSDQSSFDDTVSKPDVPDDEDILILSKLEETSELSKSTSHISKHSLAHVDARRHSNLDGNPRSHLVDSRRHSTVDGNPRRLTKSSEFIEPPYRGGIQLELTTQAALQRDTRQQRKEQGKEVDTRQHCTEHGVYDNQHSKEQGKDNEHDNRKDFAKEYENEHEKEHRKTSEEHGKALRESADHKKRTSKESKESKEFKEFNKRRKSRDVSDERIEDKENADEFGGKHRKLKRLSVGPDKSFLEPSPLNCQTDRTAGESDRSSSEKQPNKSGKPRDKSTKSGDKGPIPSEKSSITGEKSPIPLEKTPITSEKTRIPFEKSPISHDKSPGDPVSDRSTSEKLGKPHEKLGDARTSVRTDDRELRDHDHSSKSRERDQRDHSSKEREHDHSRRERKSKSKSRHKHHTPSSHESAKDHRSHSHEHELGNVLDRNLSHDPAKDHRLHPEESTRVDHQRSRTNDPTKALDHRPHPNESVKLADQRSYPQESTKVLDQRSYPQESTKVLDQRFPQDSSKVPSHPVYGSHPYGVRGPPVESQASFDFEFLDIGFQPENFPHATQQQVIQDINVLYTQSVKDKCERYDRETGRESERKETEKPSRETAKLSRESENVGILSDKLAKESDKLVKESDTLGKGTKKVVKGNNEVVKSDRLFIESDKPGNESVKLDKVSVKLNKESVKLTKESDKLIKSDKLGKETLQDTSGDVKSLEEVSDETKVKRIHTSRVKEKDKRSRSKEQRHKHEDKTGIESVADPNQRTNERPREVDESLADKSGDISKEPSRSRSKDKVGRQEDKGHKHDRQHKEHRHTKDSPKRDSPKRTEREKTLAESSPRSSDTPITQDEDRPKLVKCKLRDTREATFTKNTYQETSKSTETLDTPKASLKPSASGEFILRNEINYKLIKINKIKSDTNIKVTLRQDQLSVLERKNSKSTPNILLVDDGKEVSDPLEIGVRSGGVRSEDKNEPFGARNADRNALNGAPNRPSSVNINIVKDQLGVDSNNLINLKEFKSEQKLISDLNDDNKNTNCLNEFKYLGSFDLLDTIQVPTNVSKLYRFASTGVEIQDQDKLPESIQDTTQSEPIEDLLLPHNVEEESTEDEKDSCSTKTDRSLEGDRSIAIEQDRREKDSSIVLFVEEEDELEEEDMTVTASTHEGPPQSNAGANGGMLRNWGTPYTVEIYRDKPTASLGISVVGGKVDLGDASGGNSGISGIFIKNVIPHSPAGLTQQLKTGDRILEVDGIDVRTSSHEQAVDIIRAAGNPVRLLIQSLVQWSTENDESGASSHNYSGGLKKQSTRKRAPIAPSTPSPAITPRNSKENILDGLNNSASTSSTPSPMFNKQASRQSISVKRAPSEEKLLDVPEEKKKVYSSDSENSSDEEDTRDLEGKIKSKAGVEIMRASAANVKRTKEEIAADTEEEDQFGYTMKNNELWEFGKRKENRVKQNRKEVKEKSKAKKKAEKKKKKKAKKKKKKRKKKRKRKKRKRKKKKRKKKKEKKKSKKKKAKKKEKKKKKEEEEEEKKKKEEEEKEEEEKKKEKKKKRGKNK
ncbi:hypothetical protein M8J77_011552 [Diaphorina citri]|nr:hypothetical protein M8J77_011552 [Diaphorina citri]